MFFEATDWFLDKGLMQNFISLKWIMVKEIGKNDSITFVLRPQRWTGSNISQKIREVSSTKWNESTLEAFFYFVQLKGWTVVGRVKPNCTLSLFVQLEAKWDPIKFFEIVSSDVFPQTRLMNVSSCCRCHCKVNVGSIPRLPWISHSIK